MPLESAKVLGVALALVSAIADGEVSAQEARDLLEEIGDALGDVRAVEDLIEFVADLLHRDGPELLAKATKLEAKGKTKHAARLRARAAEL